MFYLPFLTPDYVNQLDSYIRERFKLAVHFFRIATRINEIKE